MKTTVNFERILCPVAESHETDKGLHYAIALARSYGAKLFVLTCTNKSSANTSKTDSAIRAGVKRAIEDSFVMFQIKTPRLDWELIVIEGNHPSDSIKNEAEQKNIDLIVMSARRVPHTAVRLGFTTETVCRSAPCPVLVTRAGRADHPSAIRNLKFKRLLVANDFSHDSQLASRYGLSLAEKYQSDLHLLHVVTESKLEPPELTSAAEINKRPDRITAGSLHESVPSETDRDYCGLKRKRPCLGNFMKNYRPENGHMHC
jgi:nucleotide-binding universal stress UspA family protein